MPVTCPTSSTLECICIGGQLSVACCDQDGEWPEIRVVANLNGPGGGSPMVDPSNCSFVSETTVEQIITGTNGCWCTCPLLPNKAENPDEAIQPSGTSWSISVQVPNSSGPGWSTVVGPIDLEIDADKDYAAMGDCCIIQGPCGECVNLLCLIDPLPTDPPTDRFCAAVYACLPPLVGTNLMGGDNITGSWEDGYVLDLTCEDICACIPGPASADGSVAVSGDCLTGWDLSVTTSLVDDGDGSITYTDPTGTTNNIPICDLLDDIPIGPAPAEFAYMVLETDGAGGVVGCSLLEPEPCDPEAIAAVIGPLVV